MGGPGSVEKVSHVSKHESLKFRFSTYGFLLLKVRSSVRPLFFFLLFPSFHILSGSPFKPGVNRRLADIRRC